MFLKNKTKPLTIISSIEELWDVVALMQENQQMLEEKVFSQDAHIEKLEFHVAKLERLLKESEVETKRLY